MKITDVDLMILKNELGFDLKKPCDDCPFMKTTEFHEGIAENFPMYLEMIESGKFAHTCHKTDNREAVDGPRNYQGTVQHCVGSILMLFRTSQRYAKHRGVWLQAGIRTGLSNGKLTDEHFGKLTEQAKRDRNIFTLPEMIRFILKGITRLAKRAKKEESQ